MAEMHSFGKSIKFHKSIFSQIINKFTINNTSEFISPNHINKEDIFQKINQYSKSTGIMIGNTEIANDFFIYSFVFDEEIILFDQNSLLFYRSFFDHNQGQIKFYFLNDSCRDQFQKNSEIKEERSNFTIEKSKISEMLFDCIILKSQIRTRNRRFTNNQNNNEFFLNDFIIIKSYRDSTSLCFNIKDQFLYILKKFDISDLMSKGQFEHEINFYNKSNNESQFISKYYGQFQYLNKKYIVIEYIEGQKLYNFINDESKSIDYFDKIRIIIQIMLSIEYIHLKLIIYRDINYENIIIDSFKNAIFIDFDHSANKYDDMKTGDIGIQFFQSPEQFSSNEYSFKSDIFSLGKLILFILTGKNEMYSNDIQDIINDINVNEKYKEMHEEIKKICLMCIQQQPKERPNIIDILNNIFQLSNDKMDNEERLIIEELKKIHHKQFLKLFELEDTIKDDSITFTLNKIKQYDDYISQDINGIIKYLTLASDLNSSDAQYVLGDIYYSGEYVKKDLDKAIHLFTLASNLNHSKAQLALGAIYFKKNDIKKSIIYYTLSANSGNALSQASLGLIYSGFKNNNCYLDLNKSEYYLKLACSSDNDDIVMHSQVLYAKLFYRKDLNKYIYYLTLFSKSNNHIAQYLLGVQYLYMSDIDKSLYFLNLSASNNYPLSQYLLGTMYYTGKYVPKNINKSIHYLKLASDQNLSEAQLYLGCIYLFDNSIDYNQSIHYLTLSSNQNNGQAQYILGRFYLFNDDSFDLGKAIHYFTLALNNGQSASSYYLGYIYYTYLNNIPQCINKSIHYFTFSSYLNDPYAQYCLGEIYYLSKYVQTDLNKAIYYLELASKQNLLEAQYLLGYIYFSEKDKFDINKSIYYFTLASNQNHPEAQFYLGVIFLLKIFKQQDIYKSIYYLTLALNQKVLKAHAYLSVAYLTCKSVFDINKGLYHLKVAVEHKNAYALYYLGCLYYQGKFVKRNIKKSIELLELSANQFNNCAQFSLGYIFYTGLYIPRDINKSIHYFTLSANKNNAESQYYLGEIYYFGEYVKRDINKAIYYLKLASDQNKHEASFILGEIYNLKKFGFQDMKKAIYYYKESSCFNNNKAKNNLGVIYKNGKGVEKNISQSIAYFEEGIRQNNDYFSFYNLIRIYFYGIEVKQDINKTKEIIQKATQFRYTIIDILSYVIFLCGDERINDKNKAKFYLKRIEQNNEVSDSYKNFFSLLLIDNECIKFFYNRLNEFFKVYDLIYLYDQPFYNDLKEYLRSGHFKEKEEEKTVINPTKQINNMFFEGFDLIIDII